MFHTVMLRRHMMNVNVASCNVAPALKFEINDVYMELVKQVVLNSHQDFANHCSVRIDIGHAIHRRLAILDTVGVLLQGCHRIF